MILILGLCPKPHFIFLLDKKKEAKRIKKKRSYLPSLPAHARRFFRPTLLVNAAHLFGSFNLPNYCANRIDNVSGPKNRMEHLFDLSFIISYLSCLTKRLIFMKVFNSRFNALNILIISLIIFLNIKVIGQDISTVGEIYDFEVGDIFHYGFHSFGDMYPVVNRIYNAEIINKYYSQYSDTLFYIKDVKYKQQTWGGWIYYSYLDTVYYYHLDSLINNGDIDSVYTNLNLYNGRTINYVQIYSPYDIAVETYTIGCGLTTRYYENWSNPFISEWWLIYYQKGNEEWGFPNIVTTISSYQQLFNISVYPNPAIEWLYFKQSNPRPKYNIELRNLNGQLVKKEKNIHSSHYALNVADLKAGVYFYLIRDGDNVLQQGKVIVK